MYTYKRCIRHLLLFVLLMVFACKKNEVPQANKINIPPVSNAGPDQAFEMNPFMFAPDNVISDLSITISLNGTLSTDKDGSLTSFAWTFLDGLSKPKNTQPYIYNENLRKAYSIINCPGDE